MIMQDLEDTLEIIHLNPLELPQRKLRLRC